MPKKICPGQIWKLSGNRLCYTLNPIFEEKFQYLTGKYYEAWFVFILDRGQFTYECVTDLVWIYPADNMLILDV